MNDRYRHEDMMYPEDASPEVKHDIAVTVQAFAGGAAGFIGLVSLILEEVTTQYFQTEFLVFNLIPTPLGLCALFLALRVRKFNPSLSKLPFFSAAVFWVTFIVLLFI